MKKNCCFMKDIQKLSYICGEIYNKHKTMIEKDKHTLCKYTSHVNIKVFSCVPLGSPYTTSNLY